MSQKNRIKTRFYGTFYKKISISLYLHTFCYNSNLGHLVCIWTDVGRDAEQHFDMLPHLLWDLVQQGWTHGAQLKIEKQRQNGKQSRQEGNSNSNTLLRNSAPFLAMICSKT